MGVFNFLSGSKNNTRKNTSPVPMTENNIRRKAEMAAQTNTRSKYGRLGQARVANILRTPGEFQKTNEVAVYQQGRTQKYIEKFTADLAKEMSAFGDKEEVKGALEGVINEIDTSLSANNANTVMIKVPRVVAKLLKGILKVLLYSLGLIFTILMVALGNTNGISAIYTAPAVSYNEKDYRKYITEGGRKTMRNRRN